MKSVFGQSPYETYGAYQKRVLCDNASTFGHSSLSPQCSNGKKEFECTVIYNEGKYGSDTRYLCKACREALKKEARRHGYKFKSKKL